MTKLHPERRRFRRITASHPLLVTAPLNGGERTLHQTEVVGMNGLMFTSEKSFGRGTLLLIDLAVDERIVELVARVAYERVTVVGDLEVGVEFTNLRDFERGQISSLVEMSA